MDFFMLYNMYERDWRDLIMLRNMPHLQGGETEKLTQNYWSVHAIVWNKRSTDEDIFNCKKQYMKLLSIEEIMYLYWEITYSNSRNTMAQMRLMKEYLLSEYLDRTQMRGDYKNG